MIILGNRGAYMMRSKALNVEFNELLTLTFCVGIHHKTTNAHEKSDKYLKFSARICSYFRSVFARFRS